MIRYYFYMAHCNQINTGHQYLFQQHLYGAALISTSQDLASQHAPQLPRQALPESSKSYSFGCASKSLCFSALKYHSHVWVGKQLNCTAPMKYNTVELFVGLSVSPKKKKNKLKVLLSSRKVVQCVYYRPVFHDTWFRNITDRCWSFFSTLQPQPWRPWLCPFPI